MNHIGILGLGAIGSVMANSLLSNEENSMVYHTRTPKDAIRILFDSKKSKGR